MKLRRYIKFFEDYNIDMEPAKKVLNDKKLSHSQRVADMVIKLDNREELYQAAFYHDFLERGGSLNQISKLLSPYSIEIIKALSKDEGDNDTLESLKSSIQGKDKNLIQDILLIKLIDRWDNISSKLKNGDLNTKYLKKSRELVRFIYQKYPGDKSKIEPFIINNLSPILNKGY
jgi:DNA primase